MNRTRGPGALTARERGRHSILWFQYNKCCDGEARGAVGAGGKDTSPGE